MQINNMITTINQNKAGKNSTAFKGHTEKATPIYPQRHGGSGSGLSTQTPIGYDVHGAVPNYIGAYPNEYTKIYSASPFEIVPEEAYKTHDYTKRNDMRLSDIQRIYKEDSYVGAWGNNPLSKNAVEEQDFLKDILYKAQIEEGLQAEKNNRIKGMLELSKSRSVKENLQTQLKKGENDLIPKTRQTVLLKETLEKANERYNLLKEMDDLASDRNSVKDYIANPWKLSYGGTYAERAQKEEDKLTNIFAEHKKAKNEHKNTLDAYATLAKNEKIDKETYHKEIEKELNRYKEQYTNALRDATYAKLDWNRAKKWSVYEKDLPKALKTIEQKMEDCMKKIEIFYKAKYPHWL